MFSITIMASSMTIPTASVSPSSVIELRLKSISFITVNVATMDVGIATELISTMRQSRMNSHTMNDASKLPRTRCSSSAATEALMYEADSLIVSIRTPGGRVLLMISILAWTPQPPSRCWYRSGAGFPSAPRACSCSKRMSVFPPSRPRHNPRPAREPERRPCS